MNPPDALPLDTTGYLGDRLTTELHRHGRRNRSAKDRSRHAANRREEWAESQKINEFFTQQVGHIVPSPMGNS